MAGRVLTAMPRGSGGEALPEEVMTKHKSKDRTDTGGVADKKENLSKAGKRGLAWVLADPSVFGRKWSCKVGTRAEASYCAQQTC